MNMDVKDSPNVPSLNVLNDDELEQISGGMPLLLFAANTAVIFGALSAAEAFGQRIGSALYYASV